jgi:hypothetical protein
LKCQNTPGLDLFTSKILFCTFMFSSRLVSSHSSGTIGGLSGRKSSCFSSSTSRVKDRQMRGSSSLTSSCSQVQWHLFSRKQPPRCFCWVSRILEKWPIGETVLSWIIDRFILRSLKSLSRLWNFHRTCTQFLTLHLCTRTKRNITCAPQTKWAYFSKLFSYSWSKCLLSYRSWLSKHLTEVTRMTLLSTFACSSRCWSSIGCVSLMPGMGSTWWSMHSVVQTSLISRRLCSCLASCKFLR